jgi:membrane protease subunit HflK
MLNFIFRKIGLKFSLGGSSWGNNPQDSKPDPSKPENNKDENVADIDRLWKEFTEQWGGIFGKKPNNSSGSNNQKNRPNKSIIVLVMGFFAFLWFSSGFFIVQEGQTGVISTFGKYSYSTTSGFKWRWPTPFQSHEVVNVSQVRTVEVGYRNTVKNKQPKEALMLTDDENIVDVQLAAQYRLKSASSWLFNNRDQEELIRQVAETSIREIVGKNKMDFVLYEGREKVALDTAQLMQQIVDRYKAGVQITNVTMQGVQPPEQVQAAFDDAVKAGQDLVRQKNEGQAYANDVIPRAKGAASRLLQEAEAYRSKVEANAQGDVARFNQIYVEYKKAPAVTRDRMYLETMQQIFTNTTKLMVDSKNNNSLLYLPLDKLISQTAGELPKTAPTTPEAPNNANNISSTVKDPRARDSRTPEGR